MATAVAQRGFTVEGYHLMAGDGNLVSGRAGGARPRGSVEREPQESSLLTRFVVFGDEVDDRDVVFLAVSMAPTDLLLDPSGIPR